MRASRTVVWLLAGGLSVATLAAQQASVPGATPAQDIYNNSVHYARGQSLQPVFEGW